MASGQCKPDETRRGREALGLRADLYGNETYADVDVICGSQLFKVHKVIVCGRSGFFSAGASKLTKPVFSLGEEDPDVVRLLLYYIYHLSYPDKPTEALAKLQTCRAPRLPHQILPIIPQKRVCDTEKGEGPSEATEPKRFPLALHAKVFVAAKKYGVIGLDKQAEFYFACRLTRLSNRELSNERPLKPREMGRIEIADAIKVVYAFEMDDSGQITNVFGEQLESILSCALVGPSSDLMFSKKFPEIAEAVDSIKGLLRVLLEDKLRMPNKLSSTCEQCGDDSTFQSCDYCGFSSYSCMTCIEKGGTFDKCINCGRPDPDDEDEPLSDHESDVGWR